MAEELLAKHVRLYEEMIQMIGELVDLLQDEKVLEELFAMYCCHSSKELLEAL